MSVGFKKIQRRLEKNKEGDQKIETSSKRKILNDELLTVKKKRFDEEVLMKKLNDNADKFIKQAAQDGEIMIYKFM